jgi:ankyrin repeat protein
MQFGSFFLISVIRGNTALMRSSMKGHLDVTRFLVESKANLEAKDNTYYTPYNMIFQIARTAAVRFNFCNFYYQWLQCAHVVLL